jgi:hypothetical protein
MLASVTPLAQAQDASPAPFLQWFDSSFETMNRRSADVFMAGYGAVWIPPPGRADSGDQSVGYDVYDRFEFGSWDRKTLYGTEAGLRRWADNLHRQGNRLHIDAVINHNGFSDQSTPGFIESGGYPGFLLQNPDGGDDPFGVPGTDGDFNSGFDYSVLRGRLAGLIDIDHGTDFRFIRNPVPGYDDPVPGVHGGNLPAGTTEQFGRLANIPDENNRRFYPDLDGEYISVFDPLTGEQDIRIYKFNKENPLAGDPVGENATGYLMRYLQYMVQDIGVDGLRIDAAKHVEGFAFGFFDRAVYRANDRKLLDGSTDHVFSYLEVFDGDLDTLQSYVRKDINPNDPGRVGGNRDSLDFAFHFAQKANLTGNGFQNDWRNLVRADMDYHDDGLYNGSSGVKFVASHDENGPGLSNVAHAQMLMLPGNNVVYFNGKEFGDGRDFPKDGRGDALGGVFGDTITDLVQIRNTHARGDYRERYLDKELYAFERSNNALVLLNNRTDDGFDTRRLDVDFAWGTTLVELTGNAGRRGDIAELVTVDNDFFEGPSKATVRFARNNGSDQGYLVYGLATPDSQDGIELAQASGAVAVLEGSTPAANNYANGTTRLTDLHVITDDQFTLSFATQARTLTGTRLEGDQLVQRSIRDRDADGDNALFRFDAGLNLNGINPNGTISGVDYDSPGSVVYGFEEFNTAKQAGYFSDNGDGFYQQVIDTTGLSEGEHYITVRAFRHREDGGPAVFSEFKKVIYVDRLDPISGVYEMKKVNADGSGDRDLIFESTDFTADSMHVFLNLGEAVSDQDILNRAANGEGSTERVDLNLFKQFAGGMGVGNHTFTIVTFEPTGNSNVQRFTGQQIVDGLGAGFGDLDFDGQYETTDLANTPDAFEALLYSRNARFNPAADLDGDGRIDWADLAGLKTALTNGAADQAVLDEYDAVLRRRGNVNQAFGTDSFDIDELARRIGSDDWYADIDSSGTVDQNDKDLLVQVILNTFYADANLDQQVTISDFETLESNFGMAGGWAEGDFSGDGQVTAIDFEILQQFFGSSISGSEVVSTADRQRIEDFARTIPEPTTMLLLATILPLAARRRSQASR